MTTPGFFLTESGDFCSVLSLHGLLNPLYLSHRSASEGRQGMFRMWGKLKKNNRLLDDTTICIGDYSLSRTQMVFQALEEICYYFDLGKPIWLDSNVRDFQIHAKTRFGQDNFIEHIEFDFLEIQVIEE